MDGENNNGITKDEEAAALQRGFISQGWNVAGANLLAVSCWQAKTVYMYFRSVISAVGFTSVCRMKPLMFNRG